MAASTVDQARARAREQALAAMEMIIKIALAKKAPRNAQAQLAAGKVVLEMAGVLQAMSAERAVETLLEAMKPHLLGLPGDPYAALIRAYATVRGVASSGAGSAPAASASN